MATFSVDVRAASTERADPVVSFIFATDEGNQTMYSMKRMVLTFKKFLFLTALLCSGGIALSPNTAGAGALVFDTVDNCTTLNCRAVFLNGISQRNAFGDTVPFILQVFADENQCIRLDVTSQNDNMEIVLVSPSGLVWRNDNFNGTRPLVTARANVKGYYTVQISQANGVPLVNSVQLFRLAYGLYVPGTMNNCPF